MYLWENDNKKIIYNRDFILILGQICLIKVSAMLDSYICIMQYGNQKPHVPVEHLNVAIVIKELNFKLYLI